jgi:hypothetical protein
MRLTIHDRSSISKEKYLDRSSIFCYAFSMAKKKNPAAVALGRLGGLKGGVARAKMLTPEQRSEIARKAVLARWKRQQSTPK